MALVFADRVKETSTTTGTGTLDLLGPATGFQGFVLGIGDTNTTKYTIEAIDGNGDPTGEWEVGIGTVTDAGTDTLSRDIVLASSNSGALVNFSAGTKQVFCDHPAQETQQAGCRVKLNANFSVPETTTDIDFVNADHEIFDTDGFHEGVTNPERLTIPAGLDGTYLVVGCIRWAANTADIRQLNIIHNDSSDVLIDRAIDNRNAPTSLSLNMCGVLITKAVAGDYFKLQGAQFSGGNLDALGGTAQESLTSFTCWRIGP